MREPIRDKGRLEHILTDIDKANAMATTSKLSPNAHAAKEMDTILKERIRRAESGEERIIPNQKVVDFINDKYGFEYSLLNLE